MSAGDSPTLPETEEGSSRARPTRIDHFDIVRRVGAGGMGVVYEARDTLLDRPVALKVLHPSKTGGDIGPARLFREAQALAKLSHPNVVGVYEVGSTGDEPFIAMELVDGVTLAEWMKTKREWREVLDVFIAAGRGLAAVHALGLVHRDFKPSNVLFDKQGVPKLGDFGLVAAIDELVTQEIPAVSVDLGTTSSDGQTMTQPGSIMGTPAYMAPEQMRGARVDARADVYAFAKSLKEALPDPPSSIEPILQRALAKEPRHRYPGMEPMLNALAKVRRGNKNALIFAGASLAIFGVVTAAWGLGRSHATTTTAAPIVDPCPDPSPRFASVWNPARKAKLEAHLAGIDPAQGKSRAEVASKIFERTGKRWGDTVNTTCRRSLEHDASPALFAGVTSCLDLALVELEQTILSVERTTDVRSIDTGMRAVVGMSLLDDCERGKELIQETPLPTDTSLRVEALAIQRESVELSVALRSGTAFQGLHERAQVNADRARKLDHAPTLARAMAMLALIEFQDESAAAVDTMHEAINAASAGHADRVAADLWNRLLVALRTRKQDAEALALLPAADAAFARIDASPRLRSQFLQTKALLSMTSGDEAQARAFFDQAIQILVDAGADTIGSQFASSLVLTKAQQASVLALGSDWPALVKSLTEILPLAVATYGADHSNLIDIHFNLGVGYKNLHDDKASLAAFREAARIADARLAPGAKLASVLNAAGSLAVAMGQVDEQAVAFLEHAVEMARQGLPADDPRLAVQLSGLGTAYQAVERFDDARKLFEEMIHIYEVRHLESEAGWRDAVYSLGAILASEQKCTDALPYFDRALAAYQQHKSDYDITDTRLQIAACHRELKHHAQALRLTSAILAATEIEPLHLAQAHGIHGCTLIDTGKTAPGVAEVQAAHAELTKLEANPMILDEISACLPKP